MFVFGPALWLGFFGLFFLFPFFLFSRRSVIFIFSSLKDLSTFILFFFFLLWLLTLFFSSYCCKDFEAWNLSTSHEFSPLVYLFSPTFEFWFFLFPSRKLLTVILLIFKQKKCNYSKISQLPSHTFRLFHYVFIIPSRSSLQPQEEGLNPFHLLIIQIPWKARVIESSLTLMILDI